MSEARAVVTVIPPTLNVMSNAAAQAFTKRLVAGYARVSTDEEEQLNSYEAQVDFYTKYIKENPAWEFVEVYTDEGISATSTKKRDGFNRMVRDALAGKINLIVTKSVSRFARNTVDTLTTVRQLKAAGVEVYFEKENIYTFDGKGELLITIMSSLAQEESRSISENVTWGQRKRMQDGKVTLPYSQFLGYEKGEDGIPKIVEEEAKIVRLIYKLFLLGRSQNAIAKHLTEQGILTPSGKEVWSVSTVMSILQNEKYRGDAKLQKTFTVDFLTKQTKVNEGEIPQYYVENSHPAIIEPEVFDMVQVELGKRKARGRQQSGLGCFSSRILCGECGGFYGSKVWHSNSKYRRTVWQCNHKFKGKDKCQTPHLNEDTIQRAFVRAFNMLIEHREQIIADCGTVLMTLTDTKALDTEAHRLLDDCSEASILVRELIDENARAAINQEDYQRRYAGLMIRYEDSKGKHCEVMAKLLDRRARREAISRFLEDLSRQEGLLAEFDEDIWCATVEAARVQSDEVIAFTFKDGRIIKVDVRE